MTLAQLVRNGRHACDLTQHRLAQRLRVDDEYIERLERGEWRPSKHLVWRLADALRMKRNILLGADDYD